MAVATRIPLPFPHGNGVLEKYVLVPFMLLPLSVLGGAGLLLATDLGVRLTRIDAGAAALLGAPFFLALVLRHRRNLA